VPVERNKLVIDNLPESSFSGTVRVTVGTSNGGMVAFSEGHVIDASVPVLVAQLHPAGVTSIQVGGPAAITALRPGMTVRLRATVDDKGRASAPARAIEIVSPPVGFTPDAVRPHAPETIVGDVQRVTESTLLLHVAAGRIRRLTLPLAADATVMVVDASRVDLIAPGDSLEVTGRMWSGDGCMGGGTVFASRVVVHKSAQKMVNAAEDAGDTGPVAVSTR